MDKRKIAIYGGLTLAASVGGYMYVHSQNNKKLIAQLNDILDRGTQATGTPEDVKSDDAFDPSFYKRFQKMNLGVVNLVKASEAEKMAKRIYDDVGTFTDDEADIIKALKMIGTKTKLSFVSEKFLQLYGKNLGSFIIEHVDKDDNPKIVQSIIKNMRTN